MVKYQAVRLETNYELDFGANGQVDHEKSEKLCYSSVLLPSIFKRQHRIRNPLVVVILECLLKWVSGRKIFVHPSVTPQH